MAIVKLLVVIIVAPLSLAATSPQTPAVESTAAAESAPAAYTPQGLGATSPQTPVVESTAAAESAPTAYTPQRLEALVAPIALHPDPLVAQLLTASTYPLEVVQASRWVKSNAALEGEALTQALEQQPWDPSVKALVNFPQVLDMMDKDLSWTQQLGDAFLAQQEGVLDAIQRLRGKAQSQGNLASTEQQTVTVEPATSTIVIEPADPQVVYVPTYNPSVVYGSWPYPSYPPYYYYPPGYVAGTAAVSFVAGVAIGAAWGYAWNDCDWDGGEIDVDINRNRDVNRNINRGDYARRGEAGAGGKWQHSPSHRKGVPYSDQRTASRYNRAAASPGAASRQAYRGRTPTSASLGGGGTAARAGLPGSQTSARRGAYSGRPPRPTARGRPYPTVRGQPRPTARGRPRPTARAPPFPGSAAGARPEATAAVEAQAARACPAARRRCELFGRKPRAAEAAVAEAAVAEAAGEAGRLSRNRRWRDRTVNCKIARTAPRASCVSLIVALAAAAMAAVGRATTAARPAYSSPQQAVDTVVAAARNGDSTAVAAAVGPGAEELVSSGDPVADRERRDEFLQAYDEKHSLVPQDGEMVLVVGPNDWPFPIPLVENGGSWVFDVERGSEEILDRRIGQNELYTMQSCLALVDAQREYATSDRDGDAVLEYATRFISTTGAHDGLYWPTASGEEPSPLGALAAQAENQGYKWLASTGEPVPFHGYYYRMLFAQGKDAPGGAYDYMAGDKMIGGFAAVAYPAAHGNSGVMTFMVSDAGTVYQKDLGADAAEIASAMTEFSPDSTWTRVASLQ